MNSRRMFPSALAGFLTIAVALSPTHVYAAQSTERKAVVAAFQTLLDGLAKRDKSVILAQLLPGGNATLMRDGKPVQMSFEAFADRLSQPGTEPREERIRDPLVRIDDNIAILWAPFEFLVNGKVDHCGRDVVTLVRLDGRWLISGIGDTSRKDCAGRS